MALLDLTGAGAAESLNGSTRIADVATILVPDSLLPRLTSIPMEHVAATVPIPDVVAGQVVLTSPVERVDYKQLIVMGQLLAPVGSETGLGAGLTRMSGQVQYFPYTARASVRVATGSVRFTSTGLANPTGQPTDILVSVGQLVIDQLDVLTVADARQGCACAARGPFGVAECLPRSAGWLI